MKLRVSRKLWLPQTKYELVQSWIFTIGTIQFCSFSEKRQQTLKILNPPERCHTSRLLYKIARSEWSAILHHTSKSNKSPLTDHQGPLKSITTQYPHNYHTKTKKILQHWKKYGTIIFEKVSIVILHNREVTRHLLPTKYHHTIKHPPYLMTPLNTILIP